MKHYDLWDLAAIAGGLLLIGVLGAGVLVSTRLAGEANAVLSGYSCDCSCQDRRDPERAQ